MISAATPCAISAAKSDHFALRISIRPMEAASAWPGRQMRPKARKLPLIISVVKIKMVRHTQHAFFFIPISPRRSNIRTIDEENRR